MGRGGAIYLSYMALVLLTIPQESHAGLWDVDIDLSPAPPAESGPPFSFHATRDRSLLPYQIIGIVGAYVGSVLLIGTFLLTFGRSLRKRAQAMAEKPVEMVKPVHKNFDPSPMSPTGSTKGWLRRKAGSMRSGKSNVASPGMRSVASFDQSVVDADRRRQDEELAQLYGHVLEYDDARELQDNRLDAGAPPAYPRRERPTLPALQRVQSSEPPLSPRSPRSPGSPYYAVPPPKNLLAQLSPTYKPPQQDLHSPAFSSNQAAPSSPVRFKKSVKQRLGKLDISGPMQGLRDNEDGARTPLSPRLYQNPGPPPEPPSARTVDTYPYTPTTPGTALSNPFPEEDELFDDVRDLPPAHPQRMSSFSREQQPRSPTSPGLPSSPAQFRVGSPPRRGQTPVGNVGNADRPLAFRQLAEQHKQAAVSNSELNLSAPPGWSSVGSPRLQTTEVYTRERHFLVIGSAALHSPRVYTPYMPIAPPTPVTPHLTTRLERRQREKEDRTIRGAITEEEQVQDEKDMWGDAY
ncbi:hypothetical protein CB0940_08974 [Cercospora beticola]|uniref:Vacuolar membrane protein n=1 Tax=Cercospora beticola TaxID=122368 RepID=A0A2G5HR94_CERBT|nr:hypothetical protein CB0940_08974 [Cercospora beticola]PIA95064.1 hypothetical protein CB0940_08974 [Cercospora beticola]WPB05572.1 hypothetical protein RHO25_010225 [Cercospora beticola]